VRASSGICLWSLSAVAALLYKSPNANLVSTGEEANTAESTLNDAPLPDAWGNRYTKQLPSSFSHSSGAGRAASRPSASYGSLCG